MPQKILSIHPLDVFIFWKLRFCIANDTFNNPMIQMFDRIIENIERLQAVG